MNTMPSPSKKSAAKRQNAPFSPLKPPRMRPALRLALAEIVEKGVTQREAAKRVGMTETALGRALKRAPIKAWLEAQLAQYALDADTLKGRAKVMAIHTGIDLMHNAQSEAVKARMVELFAGEAKNGTQVNVNIGAKATGYEYARPGARIIEISAGDEGAPDSQSSAEFAQGTDNIEDAEFSDPTNDQTNANSA